MKRSLTQIKYPELPKIAMQEHTVTLQEDEFKLFQRIRNMSWDSKTKKRLIEELIQQIEEFFSLRSSKKTIKWLQVGDKTCFRSIQPVKPEKGTPLASDIILEQRNRLAGNSK